MLLRADEAISQPSESLSTFFFPLLLLPFSLYTVSQPLCPTGVVSSPLLLLVFFLGPPVSFLSCASPVPWDLERGGCELGALEDSLLWSYSLQCPPLPIATRS